MKVVYAPAAKEFLDKCDQIIRKKILKKIRFYADSPDPLEFAETLIDDFEAPYRYRIGKDWRVKFTIESNLIFIKRIGRRDKIYN